MQFANPLLATFALASMVALPAHAELDVASLKQSIETSFEHEYPKLDAPRPSLRAKRRQGPDRDLKSGCSP